MNAAIRAIYLRDISTLCGELDLYPDDKSLWRPVAGLPNTGGTLMLHLTGNHRHFNGAQLGSTGYVRDRAVELSTRGVSREKHTQEVDTTHQEVSEALG